MQDLDPCHRISYHRKKNRNGNNGDGKQLLGFLSFLISLFVKNVREIKVKVKVKVKVISFFFSFFFPFNQICLEYRV